MIQALYSLPEFYHQFHGIGKVEAIFYRNLAASSADILELGCGTGRLWPLFHGQPSRYLGIDLTFAMLKYFKAQGEGELAIEESEASCSSTGSFQTVRLLQASWDQIPLPSGSVDHVILPLNSILHCSGMIGLRTLFLEVNRVLRKSGECWIQLINCQSHRFRTSLGTDNILALEADLRELQLKGTGIGRITKVVERIDSIVGPNEMEEASLQWILYGSQEKKILQETICLFRASEISKVMSESGFKGVQRFGDFSLRPWRNQDSWVVLRGDT